jgi:hypothetical protein
MKIGGRDKDGIPDLMAKFKRSDVVNLPEGDTGHSKNCFVISERQRYATW